MQNLPECCVITCTDSKLKRVGSVGNPIMFPGLCTVGIFAAHLSIGKTASLKTTFKWFQIESKNAPLIPDGDPESPDRTAITMDSPLKCFCSLTERKTGKKTHQDFS